MAARPTTTAVAEEGLAFPTRRRVYRRKRDGTPDRILAAITPDIDDITTP
jgi:hypothetical protein